MKHDCYCVERPCICTPEISARIEAIIGDGKGADLTAILDSGRNGWTAEAAKFIKSPLTYGDALELAEKVMPIVSMPSGEHIRAISRLAHLLLAVEYAARKDDYADDPSTGLEGGRVNYSCDLCRRPLPEGYVPQVDAAGRPCLAVCRPCNDQIVVERAQRLTPLMAHPGRWARVAVHSQRNALNQTARALKTDQPTKYRVPPGKWDAVTRRLYEGDAQGQFALFVRYLGPDDEAK